MTSVISSGTRLGRYEVHSKLGFGGMGEVYLAEDTELGRKVALKVLPADLAQDKQRMLRFIQEARSASALSHPNVAHIYEVMEANGSRLIAMEYVEGQTLRQRIVSTRIGVGEGLETVVQVASALAAAHAAGIIHRDIKPENIMLRPDGFVKVLDFGLAKLTDRSPAREHSDSDASTLFGTSPGIVMGTVSYMSPEQARGLAVDERTDIFSLGVVLYEMIRGRRPFDGATTSDVMVSILERQPAPLIEDLPEATDELKELNKIVMKALEKDAEERYQTIKDMAVDLRKLKRRLEVQAEMERSASPESGGGVLTTASGRAAVTPQELTTARTGGANEIHTTSSLEYLVGEIKHHKRSAALVALVSIVALGGISYGIYKLLNRSKPPLSFQAMRMARLTNTGKASNAAISPDGKYVVHVMEDGGQRSLWMRHIATGSNVQIVQPAGVGYRGITFSPDSNYVYYSVNEKGDNFEGALYQVPVLGGASRRLLVNIGGSITFSPDGKRFAFVRYLGQGGSSLMVANMDGTGEQQLATRKSPNQFRPAVPTWSPDGKTIVCPSRNVTGGVHFELIEVRVEDGSQRVISSQKWQQIGRLAWLSDASGLVMIAQDQSSASPQIWQLSYPGGEARRITNDLNSYGGLSLTADSGALVTVQIEQVSNLWIVPGGEASRARQITSGVGKYDGWRGIVWTPDGKIVYRSSASGTNDVSIIEADGSNPKQLTISARDDGLSVSPDGRYIVFPSDRSGTPVIWRMDIDGSNPKQLTSGGFDFLPQCSPDGQWVVYTRLSDTPTLWKVPIDGGEAVQLTDESFWARSQEVSPDGKQVAFSYREQAPLSWRIAVIPFEGGQPTKIFNIELFISLGSALDTIRWAADGRGLTYIDTRNGVSNLWSQPLDGSSPKQLTDFKTDRIFNFDWSPDGKQLALSRGTLTSDVVLISNFK